MAYGKISTRVSPLLAQAAPKAAAQVGLGKTPGTLLSSGTAVKAPAKNVSPAVRSQQDRAMAQALGLKGAANAKIPSTGRQQQKIKRPANPSSPGDMKAPEANVRSGGGIKAPEVNVTNLPRPVPKSKPVAKKPIALTGRAGKALRSQPKG